MVKVSRANEIYFLMESTLNPSQMSPFIRGVGRVLNLWVRKNRGADIVDTGELIYALNRLGYNYNIIFKEDREFFIGTVVESLFTRADTMPRDTTIRIFVSPSASIQSVRNNVGHIFGLFKAILNHELVHREQFSRNPLGSRRDISWSSNPSYERSIGRKTPKSLVKTPSGREIPQAEYMSRPEEIMAYARSVYEFLVSNPSNEYAALEIARPYFQLGRTHPTYKRFIGHLVEYYKKGRYNLKDLQSFVNRAFNSV